jgi:hypothetical protein
MMPPACTASRGSAEREVGLAHEAQERADRAGSEPEHRRAAEEVLAIELASDEFVDDVVLERPRLVAAVLLDEPLGLAVHPRISLRHVRSTVGAAPGSDARSTWFVCQAFMTAWHRSRQAA